MGIKRICLLAMLMLVILAPSAVKAETDVTILSRMGIVLGDENGLRENDTLKRCEFIAMINRCFGVEKKNEAVHFADVKQGDWFYDDFAAAVQYGYLKGNGDMMYYPQEIITREEAAALTGRLTGYTETKNTGFEDEYKISEWARGAVASLKRLGVISGHTDGSFKPDSYITRGEAFIILTNVIEKRFAGGEGTRDNPYIISEPYHLLNVKLDMSACYKMIKDISFRESRFMFSAIGDISNPFEGVFDGGGFKIIGLYTTDSSKNALFDVTGDNSEIKNIRIVCPDTYFSVCAVNNGAIRNCANTSFIEGVQQQFSKAKGGIAAVNNGVVTGCYNTSDIVTRISGDIAGGIVGENNGEISNSFNTGTLRSDYTSGIAGSNRGTITNCFNTGTLSGTNVRPVSDSNGKGITNCVYTGKNITNIGKCVTQEVLKKTYTEDVFVYTESSGFSVAGGMPFSGNENFAQFDGGDGSPDNPYIIVNTEGFMSVFDFPESSFMQMADIDVSEIVFNNKRNISFSGEYDGNGYSLSGLKNVYSDENRAMVFSENKGSIKNLDIYDCYAEGRGVSVLVNINNGTISDCNISAVLKGDFAAGIALVNNGEISGCSFSGAITAGDNGGGISASNFGKISDCLSISDMTGNSVAGIAFENRGEVETSCFFGTMSANDASGISGVNFGDIRDCYYTQGYVSCKDNRGRISAVTRSEVQRMQEGSFEKLDFESAWVMLHKRGPVPSGFSEKELQNENTVDFAGGNGTAENPYKLVTPKHLDNIRRYPGASFVMLNNIDMTDACSENGMLYNGGRGFEIIEEFKGVLYGNGCTISGLVQESELCGLINENYGVIDSVAVVCNISAGSAGIIACKNYGTVIYCAAYGNADAYICGGIVMENLGVVRGCVNNAKIRVQSLGAGISAYNRADIADCQNNGEIAGVGDDSVILGIGGGGNISTSFNSADLYFEEAVGEFYPVSDTAYKNSYYIDRYNRKFEGRLNHKMLFTTKSFEGFDFVDVWTVTQKGIPAVRSDFGCDISVSGVFDGGNGTQEAPYLVSTVQQLYNIRMYNDAYFRLTGDINLSGELSKPGLINNGGYGFSPIESFYGTIDGNGCTIYGLEYKNEGAENAGLISVLHGSVNNLIFADARIEGSKASGAVAGVNYGSIKDITVRSSRIGTNDGVSGGICGINRNMVYKSVNSGDIFSQQSSGGIAGENYGSISLCSNRGGVLTVTQVYGALSGGIAGGNYGAISECYNTGKILSYSESYDSNAGGICGINEKNILNCYNTGTYNAKGMKCNAGGIAGYAISTGKAEQCYNTGYGNIAGEGELGALIGGGDGEISFSYYEHTLALAAGENVKAYDVYPVSLQLLSSENGTEFLPDEIWTRCEYDYSLPQLIRNGHMENERIHNVRDFAGGDGSVENPFIIMTPEQLDNVRRYLGSSFVLMGDIDMSSYCGKNVFEPIGNNMFGFFGTFMGNGYKISGLTISGSSLFVQNHGEIYNLAVDRIITQNSDKSCGIAELNTGLIYQCDVNCDTELDLKTEGAFAGGIAGINLKCGMIISSFSYGSMSADAQTAYAGGICYGNYGVIAGCSNSADLYTAGADLSITGGIAGYNYGTISDCSSVADSIASTGEDNSIAGGIAGINGGTVVNCYSYNKSLTAGVKGGICANQSNGSIINCYYNEKTGGVVHKGSYAVTDSQMSSIETYEGFDFQTMWYMPDNGTPVHIR